MSRETGSEAAERRAIWTPLCLAREGWAAGVGRLMVAAVPAPGGRQSGLTGRTIEVTVIRPGVSNNGLRYGEAALAASVSLWEGAAAFCDHPGPLDQGRAGGRSVRDLVGVYGEPRYEAGRGIVAALRLYPTAEWLGRIVEAYLGDLAAGRPVARLGVSADMLVIKTPTAERLPGGRPIFEVSRIVTVNSADVVMNPAAGGRFERILEAGEVGEEEELVGEGEAGERLGDAGEGAGSRAEARRGEEGRMTERQATSARVLESAGAGTGAAGATEGPALEALRVELSRQLLEARLAGLALPESARTFIRAQLRGRMFDGAEIDQAVEAIRGLLGGVAATGVIAGAGQHRGARVTLTGRERIQAAVDRLFGLELPERLSDVPRLSGIREAYTVLTGDRFFTGRPVIEESALEANEVTTSIMADVLTDTLNKRLIKDYQSQVRWWEPICSRVPLRDMRTQTRVLLSDFASLATVAENGAYANAAWGDTKETYSLGKKGNLVYVTLETIINDDLRAVTRIPTKLASAATVTINEYVANLFTQSSGTGPTMTDGYHVFDATNHGGNYVTTALGSASLQAAMIAMAKQANSASKRLGLIGRYLLVPPDLMYTAAIITGTDRVTGSANNDINPIAGRVVPVFVPNLTDATDWYLMAAPAQIECLEMGFLNGREEPEILVQDSPTDGSVFTNDSITFKVRHIYGGGWLDYRGAYGAVVAG